MLLSLYYFAYVYICVYIYFHTYLAHHPLLTKYLKTHLILKQNPIILH